MPSGSAWSTKCKSGKEGIVTVSPPSVKASSLAPYVVFQRAYVTLGTRAYGSAQPSDLARWNKMHEHIVVFPTLRALGYRCTPSSTGIHVCVMARPRSPLSRRVTSPKRNGNSEVRVRDLRQWIKVEALSKFERRSTLRAPMGDAHLSGNGRSAGEDPVRILTGYRERRAVRSAARG